MNIDDVIKAIESTSAQADETQFYIRELKDKKEQGVVELPDSEALELIRYMVQSYETECAIKTHNAIEQIKNNAATLQSLTQFNSLIQMSRSLRKTAIETLEREINTKQYEGESTQMLEDLERGVKLDDSFANLPSSMKQEMMTNLKQVVKET